MDMSDKTYPKPSLWALLPFGVFIVLFLGAGIYYDDFYAFPAPVAISMAVIFAFLFYRGGMVEKTTTFLKGCGDQTILKMCIIYLLAGAFASVSEAIGSTAAIVDIGINYLSPAYYAAGIFVVASFLSLASGSSVGTIVAMGPIAIGLANSSGVGVNIIGAALLGGAMFGDNLSIISDTTIAATQIMGCKMSDKFKNNVKFALPAAIIATIAYIFIGLNNSVGTLSAEVWDWESALLIIPYLAVIILAFVGMDVFLVLVIGIVLSALFGFALQDFSFLTLGEKVYEGFTDMTSIFLLSLLTGGLAAMVEKAGGISGLLNLIKRRINGPKSALLGVGAFVGLTDVATANNTIAIIISGKVSQKIAQDYHIRKRVMASILDTFSCIIQSIIPYGAQILILTSYSKNSIDYPKLLAYNFYVFLLLVGVIIFINVAKIQNKAEDVISL